MPGWDVTWEQGSAAVFHGRALPATPTRSVAVLEVDHPALVLGSTQARTVVDEPAAEAAGVDVVRRRSGGGAVLLEPGGSVWVDVVVPRGDPLWDDDVGVAFHWLGRAWAAALAELGAGAVAHEGPLLRSRWSRLICFAGLGPGEVTVGGAKAVGVAQRRSRAGARFQCALLRRWDAGATVGLLALSDADRVRAVEDLHRAATGLALPTGAVVDALVSQLP